MRITTEEEKRYSLLLFYSAATHICTKCKTLWELHEIKPLNNRNDLVDEHRPESLGGPVFTFSLLD
jgi:hypothetical protein